jgi:dipeptidyl-peptidase-4
MRRALPPPAGFLFLAALLLPSFARGQSTAASPASPEGSVLTVERVSAEPDADEQSATLRWSPDSKRVAWTRLAAQSGKFRNPLPQEEIWGLPVDVSSATRAGTPDSRSGNHTKEPGSATPERLASAEDITSALRGSIPFKPRRPDEDDMANPYLLRDFAWSVDHGSLLLVGEKSMAWFELATRKPRTLLSGTDTLTDVAVSPDGKTVSFVRNHSLCMMASSGGEVRVLATAPVADVLEGELDWPYRHELHLDRAYWWSPDSSQLAYLRIDDRSVAKYRLRSSDGDDREIVYPKPGGGLPVVHVMVARASGGNPQEVALGETKNFYVPRVAWLPDNRSLAVQRLDRRQQNLELLLANTQTGKLRTLLTEKDPYWINLSDDWHFFQDESHFLWSSQRENYRHLYLYDMAGQQLQQVTKGDWEVTQVNAVDEQKGLIYFTSTRKSPLERHIEQVDLKGGAPIALSEESGSHQAEFAPDAHGFVDSFSSWSSPGRSSLVLFGKKAEQLERIAILPSAAESGNPTTIGKSTPSAIPAKSSSQAVLPPLLPVEFLTIKLHLGQTSQAFMIRPPGFDPAHKYPVIVYLAGGPGEQMVRNAWGGANELWMQLMARKGYVVFAMDNQGTAARGHYFEEPIHLRLAAQEMTDQRDGIEFLKQQPFVDTARMGVFGWGYGGFLAVHAMLDRPVPFKAGFAGAPVTDWHLYDAVFAERYLDDPVVHADGWDASSALDNARYLQGALMVAQGTEDEFVHIENLLTLQDRLLDSGKSAQVLLLADRGHVLSEKPSRLVLFNSMTDFFMKNL